MASRQALETDVRRIGEVVAAAPGTWVLDAGHTRAAFVARNMMLTTVRVHFDRLSGEITVADRIEDSRVDVILDAASIISGSQQRDDHLRSGDFLDVERYPTLTFHSTKV